MESLVEPARWSQTTESLQALYDELGSVSAVAHHLGRSTATISPYLRSMGVRVRSRGGAWQTRKRAEHRSSSGEPVVKIPLVIHECNEPHLRLNKYFTKFPVPCIKHNMMEGACAACRERYKTQVMRAGTSMCEVVDLVR